MFYNYIIVAWRNLSKNKLYSILNIGGLAVGIGVFLLIMTYVTHDNSYDRFHKNADRIFFPAIHFQTVDREIAIDRMSEETAILLKYNDPGVDDYTRIRELSENTVIQNPAASGNKFAEQKLLAADSNFFRFFSFPLLKGNAGYVLDRPFTMVISQRAAQKYFPGSNPLGKTLRYDEKYDFEITGVAASPPSNSSIDFDFVISMSSLRHLSEEAPEALSGKIEGGPFKTFLLLTNKDHAPKTAAIIQQLAGNQDGPMGKFSYSLNALVDRHRDYYDPSKGQYTLIFSWAGALVLFLALINYMSLTTARAAVRSKEVGVRKVLGAARSRVIKQFYIESGLYTSIAFLLALVLFVISRPAFNSLLQLNIDDSFLYSHFTLGVTAALFLLCLLISGSYPSLVLSSYTPAKVLYGRFNRQKGGASVRNFFTILQFTISVVLIISSVIISKQLYFFRHTDTGVDRDNIVMIPFQRSVSGHFLTFKRDIAAIRGIEGVSTSLTPMYGPMRFTGAHLRGQKDKTLVTLMHVDQDFYKLLAIRWRLAPGDVQTLFHKGQVVINEEAIKKLNLPANPVGQQIVVAGDSVQVGAVVKNFNFRSLHHKIEPLFMFTRKDTDSSWFREERNCLFVKISPNTNIPTLLSSVNAVYSKYERKTPFEYRFMDDAFDAQYRAETRLSEIFKVFTGITILIACLGLFGLSAFYAAQRTKEIGIRKVLGAKVTDIIISISAIFLKPIFISILIAIPIAGLFMIRWQQDFAFRATIGWWVFLGAAVAALLIGLLTVSFHAIKAALANPVKSLRSEG